jgi:hypothetical protein
MEARQALMAIPISMGVKMKTMIGTQILSFLFRVRRLVLDLAARI